ncbi:MAG: pyridoxal phosphate-dependent aminotransferase family protein [Saprospiraceae bacterium]|nr:pyridoxal phosphate-dependent aminotransferase family protein [Saprospiraceae bacterium]
MQGKLNRRKEQNALRQLYLPNVSASKAEDKTRWIDFCSNDYLGFSKNEQIKKAVEQQVKEADLGSTGSRLISGNSWKAEKLEERVAAFHLAEAALLFNSGYNANLGVLSSVPTRLDTIIYDQLSHASIREGIQLSMAKSFSFRHNDVEHLKQKLDKASGNIFVVVESIYSMDGDEAPLQEIIEVITEYPAVLIVDEAHGTGVIGTNGVGLVQEQGLEKEVWARIVTFGKAIGGHGAMVLGNPTLKSYLINFSRSFIYTTALPAHSLAVIDAAYDILESSDAVEQLKHKICLFKEHLSSSAKKRFINSRSAIQSLLVGGNTESKQLASRLQESGFDVKAILHPTVPKGEERLRICLHSYNSSHEIIALADCINKVLENG